MNQPRVPGPTGSWSVPNTIRAEIDEHRFHQRLLSKYGDVCQYATTQGKTYLLSGVENQTRVLVEDDDHFVKPQVRQDHPVFRTGVVAVGGEQWQSQRNRIGQVLREQVMLSRLPELRQTVQDAVSGWTESSTVVVEDSVSEAVLRVLAGLLFGDIDSLDVDRVERALLTLLEEPVLWRALTDSLFRWAPGDPLSDWRRRRGAQYTELDDELRSAVEAHEPGKSPPDFTSLLSVASTRGDLTTDNVRDELLTFLFTGYGNPTRTLTRIIGHLGNRPKLRRRLRDEVRRCSDEQIDAEAIGQMTLCKKYLSEFLRLYPPAPNISRIVTDDIEIDGYLIPADSSVVVATWHTQRDSRYWDQPSVFDPSRWSGDRGRPKYYAPFGAGLRACPARDLFYILSKVLLAIVLQRYEFTTQESDELHPGVDLGKSASITIKLKNN